VFAATQTHSAEFFLILELKPFKRQILIFCTLNYFINAGMPEYEKNYAPPG
jgi:hypothetical protein